MWHSEIFRMTMYYQCIDILIKSPTLEFFNQKCSFLIYYFYHTLFWWYLTRALIWHLSKSSIIGLVRLWNHARSSSWNQPVLSNEGKVFLLKETPGSCWPLMGFQSTTDRLWVMHTLTRGITQPLEFEFEFDELRDCEHFRTLVPYLHFFHIIVHMSIPPDTCQVFGLD